MFKTIINTNFINRSFSRYKNLLANNRRSFTFENIRQILVTQSNLFGLDLKKY